MHMCRHALNFLRQFLVLALLLSASDSQARILDTFRDIFRGSPKIEVVDQGYVQGVYTTSSPAMLEADIARFLGIPYAAPPVGDLRWAAPQPPLPFKGVHLATHSGPEPLQESFVTGRIFGSEDCLYLNVWVPKTKRPGPLPVMYWIHGGAQVLGSSNQKVGLLSLYDGAALAKKGEVIVVSVNYRLGPMGFFAHPDLVKMDPNGSTGNYGIMDLIAGLQWVQKNIENFGGDKSRVTIFGESAGGANVLALLASPPAKGLFSRAIVQSGLFYDILKEKAFAQGRKIARHYSKDGDDLSIDDLKQIDGKRITKDFPLLTPYGEPRQEFGPMWGDYVLPLPVLKAIQENKHNSVPLIIGTNGDEMKVLGPIFLKGVPQNLSDKAYLVFVSEILGKELAEVATKAYTKEKYGSNRAAIAALFEDEKFHSAAAQVARAMAKSGNPVPTYRYLFNEKVNYVGAGHAVELAYTFQNKPLMFLMNHHILNPLRTPFIASKHLALSDLMIRYWTNFAHSGNPNSADVPNARGDWQKASSGNIMEFKADGSQMIPASTFRSRETDLWNRLNRLRTAPPTSLGSTAQCEAMWVPIGL